MTYVQTIIISYPTYQDFITFIDNFDDLLEAIKDEIDDLNEDEQFEIYNENNKRILNQEQYNEEIKNSNDKKFKISVKISKKKETNEKEIKKEEKNNEKGKTKIEEK